MTAPRAIETRVGAVAIGRNEGPRLQACLTALVRDVQHVVYVDSGSTDDSLQIAEQLGVDVVRLDTSIGFTAARARNAGLRRLVTLAPGLEFVQFVDGDCQVAENWLAAGTEFLNDHPTVAVVCGRRREREPRRNVYHLLADMEWNSPIGQARACGGDALIRIDALEQVGGYRETLIAGEEPEMCVRLRHAGWKIWRLDHDMTLHDIRMDKFGQWWKRAVRAGHAYAEVAALHGSLKERERWRKLLSIWFWALLPLAAAALWPWAGAYALAGVVLMYAVLVFKIVRYRQRRHGDSRADATLYGIACIVTNWPAAIGSLKYLLNRLRGSRSRLIEYKQETHRVSA